MTSSHPLVLAGLLAAMPACGIDSGEPLGCAAESIVDGTVDETDRAVVAVGEGYTLCSGTLVAPRVVLTARHCVADYDIGTGPFCEDARFGSQKPTSSVFVSTAPAVDVQVPASKRAEPHVVAEIVSGDDPALCGTDLALLILRDPLLGIPWLGVAGVKPGDEFSAVGFGPTSIADPLPGTRRRRDGLFVGCLGAECDRADVGPGEWRGDGATCYGDSGGPALDTSGRIIGVLSRGPEACGGNAVYEMIAPWESLLRATIARASLCPED